MNHMPDWYPDSQAATGKNAVRVSGLTVAARSGRLLLDRADLELAPGRVTAVECLRYALSLPSSVVITGCDSVGVLEQALHVVLELPPLAPEEVTALLAKTREAAAQGDYEKFKTSDKFDGTAKNPKWLTTAEV